DNGRARIEGSRTFCKGSLQTLLTLEKGDSVKLTTARYYTPDGTSMQAIGLVPDVVLQPGSDAGNGTARRVSEAELPGHLQGEAEAAAADGEVLEGEAPVLAALNVLKSLPR